MLWITGCNGLLGSALLAIQNPKRDALLRTPGDKCKAALHLKNGAPEKASFLGTGKEIDIANLDAVRIFAAGHRGITHIINCAAFSHVDAAEEFHEEAYRTNAIGPENLAIVAKEIGAKLIHISTDYVFAGNGKTELKEGDETGPCSTYGKTKLEGEKRALNHSATVIRTSWIFGQGGKNFVSKLLKMLHNEQEIRLTDDQWGRFTYAPDLADAILQMLDEKGLFHFANRGVTTKYEFGLAMFEEALAMGYPIVTKKVIPVPGSSFPAPCKRPMYSALDTRLIEKQIAIRHWRETLKDFLCEQIPAYL